MCRSIRPLHNYDPPTSEAEIHEAALQYVRKISGTTRPARANEEAFARAVDAVAAATTKLLGDLVTTAPPRNRAREIERARERAAARFGERGAA
jgi:hypothetical protein